MKKFNLIIKLAFGEEKRVTVEAESGREACQIAHAAYPGNFGVVNKTTALAPGADLERPAPGLLY